mmetsp:Transcript_90352/g.179804  ORF Transcript_90352/g.179804 Transcript_90352/m.179804 type:complete len:103 (-) Transcript_90352:6-314(-)
MLLTATQTNGLPSQQASSFITEAVQPQSLLLYGFVGNDCAQQPRCFQRRAALCNKLRQHCLDSRAFEAVALRAHMHPSTVHPTCTSLKTDTQVETHERTWIL